MTALTATALGLASCMGCGLLTRLDNGTICPRCGTPVRRRKGDGLQRTTALLTAAVALFAPANLLPMMTTTTLLRQRSDTIVTGVGALWRDGSWLLALLVFVASVVVPGVKIAALTLLVISTRRRSTWRQRERTRLYRLVEVVGRWSMLDVFVMALLAALVRSQIASVQIEVGALAFAAVVVLTMLASISFDPRLIWNVAPRGSRTTATTATTATTEGRP